MPTTINHNRVATGNTKAFVTVWANLAVGDTGDAVPFSQYTDKSVQVVGTFGVGGSLTFEGSKRRHDLVAADRPAGQRARLHQLAYRAGERSHRLRAPERHGRRRHDEPLRPRTAEGVT